MLHVKVRINESTSHVNQSCHTSVDHTNESSHTSASQWVMSCQRVSESCHVCQWVVSRMTELCHVWMSHVTHERVMSSMHNSNSHANESYRIHDWVISHVNKSCHTALPCKHQREGFPRSQPRTFVGFPNFPPWSRMNSQQELQGNGAEEEERGWSLIYRNLIRRLSLCNTL